MAVTFNGPVGQVEVTDVGHGSDSGSDTIVITLSDSVAAGDIVFVIGIAGYVWPDYLSTAKSSSATVSDSLGTPNTFTDFGSSLSSSIPPGGSPCPTVSGLVSNKPPNNHQFGFVTWVFYTVADSPYASGDEIVITTGDTWNFSAGYALGFSTDTSFLTPQACACYTGGGGSSTIGEPVLDGSSSPFSGSTYGDAGCIATSELIAFTAICGAGVDDSSYPTVTQYSGTVVQDGDNIIDNSYSWSTVLSKDVGYGTVQIDSGMVYTIWEQNYDSSRDGNSFAQFASDPSRVDGSGHNPLQTLFMFMVADEAYTNVVSFSGVSFPQ